MRWDSNHGNRALSKGVYDGAKTGLVVSANKLAGPFAAGGVSGAAGWIETVLGDRDGGSVCENVLRGHLDGQFNSAAYRPGRNYGHFRDSITDSLGSEAATSRYGCRINWFDQHDLSAVHTVQESQSASDPARKYNGQTCDIASRLNDSLDGVPLRVSVSSVVPSSAAVVQSLSNNRLLNLNVHGSSRTSSEVLKSNVDQKADLMFVSGSTYLQNRGQHDPEYDVLFGTGYSQQVIMVNRSLRYWKRRVLLTMSKATGVLLAAALAERLAKFLFSTCDSLDELKEEVDPKQHQAVNSWHPFTGFLRAAGWTSLQGRENRAKTQGLCLVHERWRGRREMPLFREAFLREAMAMSTGHLGTAVDLLHTLPHFIALYDSYSIDNPWNDWDFVSSPV